jgi:hypothetical protein
MSSQPPPEVGSGATVGIMHDVHPHAAMCFVALNLTPCRGGLWRCNVSCSSKPPLPAEVGSGVATCLVALDLTSLLGWAPTLPYDM